MNDVGNVHPAQNTPPLGIEVQVLAFAFSRADALGNTTFYKYTHHQQERHGDHRTPTSRSSPTRTSGTRADDYVGSDIDAGLGYVYNADNRRRTASLRHAAAGRRVRLLPGPDRA